VETVNRSGRVRTSRLQRDFVYNTLFDVRVQEQDGSFGVSRKNLQDFAAFYTSTGAWGVLRCIRRPCNVVGPVM
jgi:hypothetical protein